MKVNYKVCLSKSVIRGVSIKINNIILLEQKFLFEIIFDQE